MAFRPMYLAVIFTILTFLAIIIAFATPYWLVSDGRLPNQHFQRIGLWEICYLRDFPEYDYHSYGGYGHAQRHRQGATGCKWLFDEEYYYFRDFILQPFFIAVQVFLTLSFVALLIALVMMIALLVCMRSGRGEGMAIGIGIVVLFAAICCTLAVIIFGACGDGRNWMPDPEHNYFSWSFGLAILGAILAYVAAILYFSDAFYTKRKNSHSTQRQSYRMEETEVKNVNP